MLLSLQLLSPFFFISVEHLRCYETSNYYLQKNGIILPPYESLLIRYKCMLSGELYQYLTYQPIVQGWECLVTLSLIIYSGFQLQSVKTAPSHLSCLKKRNLNRKWSLASTLIDQKLLY